MRVKSSFAGKRQRAAMPQDQTDALKSTLKAVAGRAFWVDIGGAWVKIFARAMQYAIARLSRRTKRGRHDRFDEPQS